MRSELEISRSVSIGRSSVLFGGNISMMPAGGRSFSGVVASEGRTDRVRSTRPGTRFFAVNSPLREAGLELRLLFSVQASPNRTAVPELRDYAGIKRRRSIPPKRQMPVPSKSSVAGSGVTLLAPESTIKNVSGPPLLSTTVADKPK